MISENYLKYKFFKDLIVILPLGGMFSYIDQRFKILWLIKAARVKDLHQYVSFKFLKPFVNSYIEHRQSAFLHHPEKREEIN